VLRISILFTAVAILLAAIYYLGSVGIANLFGLYGVVLLVRLALLVILALALRYGREERAWVLLPCALLLLTQSLLSHSAAEAQPVAPVLADWAHLTFTALWLGGVAMLALVVAPLADPKNLGAIITHFSPLAMFSVFVVTLTGIVQSASFLGSLDELVTTSYGRTIVIKVILLIVLIGFGAYHQQVISPRLQAWRLRDTSSADRATRRFRVSILLEMLVSAIILLAAGALTALPPTRSVPPGPSSPASIRYPQPDETMLVWSQNVTPIMETL
jgi:copper transport protein